MITEALDKLRAMIEPLQESSEWIESLPSEATMVRIGGAEFDYRPEETHPDLSGGVIDGCFFNERGFRSLKATFWKKKPAEPVVVERTFEDIHAAYSWLGMVDASTLGIVNNKPFKVTFEQEVVK